MAKLPPLNLPSLAAVQNVTIGPLRYFAAARHSVAFGGKADIERRFLAPLRHVFFQRK
jgi:hypothetical protein